MNNQKCEWNHRGVNLPLSDCLVFLEHKKFGLFEGRTNAKKAIATLTVASPILWLIPFND